MPLPGGLGGRFELSGDLVVTLLWQPRSKAALIVDKQLREIPLALLHVIQFHIPTAPGVGLPIGDFQPSTEDRSFIAVSLIDHGSLLGPRIFR